MDHITTQRMPTATPTEIIRNKRAGLANLTKKRVLGYATTTDLEQIKALQDEISRLQREETSQKYGAQS